MSVIRYILGKLILLLNWIFTPRGVKRTPVLQAAIDNQTSALTLYQYEACPFCVKVRRAIKRHTLNIKIKDVKRDDTAKNELLAGGGLLKVPCLRIDGGEAGVEWMYESKDIIAYLERKLGEQELQPA